MFRNVWFWKCLSPMLREFCRREGLSFNEVVNLAVQSFLGHCNLEELRLKAKLAALLKEESELRKACSCMLRSGSYLPSYVRKVLLNMERDPRHSPFYYESESGKALKTLSPEERKVFLKICAKREEIAHEVTEIQAGLLKDVKPFKLEFEGSWSRAHGKHTPVNNVREKTESDVNG